MNATVLAFLSAAIPSFFTPGPNNLMLMASSAKFGLRPTISHMLGICIGFPLMVFLVGIGLGALFEQIPAIRLILKLAAAAYLLWMAWHLLGIKIGTADSGERPLRFSEAALFQWVNPKAWAMAISFVALVTGDAENWLPPLLLTTLGCLALAPFSSIVWMVFGGQVRTILKRTGTERLLGPFMAALMVLAVILFLL